MCSPLVLLQSTVILHPTVLNTHSAGCQYLCSFSRLPISVFIQQAANICAFFVVSLHLSLSLHLSQSPQCCCLLICGAA
jgi:hypothetical protein